MLSYDGVYGVCDFFFKPAWRNVMLTSYSNGIESYLGFGTIGQPWDSGYNGHPCSVDLINSKLHTNPDPTQPDPDPNASLVTDMYLDLVISLDTTLAHPLGAFSDDVDREGRGSFSFQVGTWP